MTNLKQLKKALLSSVIALVLCFTMLLGTTFAWFTDTVTSSGNKIEAGNLKVELILHTEDGDYNISEDNRPIFGSGSIAQNDASETLWEPGKTQTVYLSIKNVGSLDLKYKVALEVTGITKNLNKVMSFIITPDANIDAPVAKDQLDWTTGTRVNGGVNVASDADVALKAGQEHFFALSVHMDEEAGNEYKNGTITFDLKVLAGQLASEFDSFDNQYDADATYPESNYVEIPSNEEFPKAGFDIDVFDQDTEEKVGSMNFPKGSLDPNATHVGGKIEETDEYEYNIAIDAGSEVRYFDISASGMKSDNDVDVTVRIYIGEGFDPDTFKVYHKDQEIVAVYNPETGYVTFQTPTFSPFAVAYDEDSTYVPGATTPEGMPKAKVEYADEYVNVDLPWGSYGQWSPTTGLDSQLEAAYVFTCLETGAEAELNEYAEWYCDFYVMLDGDLGENQIFLGGNYGDFGWVGFHNGDLTLEAGTEIPLLGSVTSNPWTYADVANFVGTFICGVGDVDNALAGQTFTVMLRLTNPADETEFYNVATITHTFTAE